MPSTAHPFTATAAGEQDAALFAALELSLSRWVVVASAPGEGKVSRHTLPACDGPALLALLDGFCQGTMRKCGVATPGGRTSSAAPVAAAACPPILSHAPHAVADPEVALIGEEQPLRDVMAELAAVELPQARLRPWLGRQPRRGDNVLVGNTA